ncbi:MAG: helix-turn-helix transcriptional regulator [Flavobacteriales bacterium]|nr:helix-turn-helix transcriptional regulator [Flavobacteriales bacterium]
MTSIKDRIIQIADIKEVNKRIFFKKINSSYSNFRGKSRNSSPSATIVAEISSKYPDVNSEWLLTGKGEMLKQNSSQTTVLQEREVGIPLIPMEAIPMFDTKHIQATNDEVGKYKIPEFEELKADFMIRIKGNSMYPKYSSGDVIACKKLPLDTFFQWNKVYVLNTSQGVMIKRIHPSLKENHILCKSDNEKYMSFNLPLKEIYSLAIVVGVISLE